MAATQIFDKERRLVTYKWLLNKVGATYKSSTSFTKNVRKALTLQEIKTYFKKCSSKTSPQKGLYVEYTVKGSGSYANNLNVIERDIWVNEGDSTPTQYTLTIKTDTNIVLGSDLVSSGDEASVTIASSNNVQSYTIEPSDATVVVTDSNRTYTVASMTSDVTVTVVLDGEPEVKPKDINYFTTNSDYLFPIGARARIYMTDSTSYETSVSALTDNLIEGGWDNYEVIPKSGATDYGLLRIAWINWNTGEVKDSQPTSGPGMLSFTQCLIFDAYKLTNKGNNTQCVWYILKKTNPDKRYVLKIPVAGVIKSGTYTVNSLDQITDYTQIVYTNINDLTETVSESGTTWSPQNNASNGTGKAFMAGDETDDDIIEGPSSAVTHTEAWRYWQSVEGFLAYWTLNTQTWVKGHVPIEPNLSGFQAAWYAAKTGSTPYYPDGGHGDYAEPNSGDIIVNRI